MIAAQLLLGSALASPIAPASVVDGEPAPHEERVVALTRDGDVLCSGLLLTERVVLTAAHCDRRDLGTMMVFVGAEHYDVAAVRTHPDYVPGGRDHDLALVGLEVAVAGVRLPVWAPPPTAGVGTEATIVGFGATAADLPGTERRTGTAVVEATGTWSVELSPAPSRSCYGDSGGPIFAADAEDAALPFAVVSGGDDGCAGQSYGALVAPHLGDFVLPFIVDVEPGTGAIGDICVDDASCVSGICVEGGGFPYCSGLCGGRARCPDAMACVEGACRYEGATPGEEGFPCDGDADCASGVCTWARDAESVCAAPCLPDRVACEPGLECIEDAGTPGRHACLQPVETGCRIGGPGGLCALLLIALLLAGSKTRTRPPEPHRSCRAG